MKCAQIKNLIGESPDLEKLEQDQEISAHLFECTACKNFLGYEKALRKGFATMADEAPPAQLAAKIFAIPEQNSAAAQNPEPSGLLQLFFNFFSDFPLKTALVSCLIGFSAALILQNQNIRPPEASGLKIAGSPAVTAPAAFNTTDKIVKNDKQNEEERIVLAQSDAAIAPEIQISMSTEIETKNETSGRENKITDEHIPGAISYSIAEEDSAPKKQAIVASDLRAARAPAPPRPLAEKSKTAFSDKEAQESFAADSLEQSEGFAKAITEPDPRCGELEKLLENYAIEVKPGFLDLKMLAARGIIETSKLSHYSPPAGMSWYVEIESGKNRVFLKNEK